MIVRINAHRWDSPIVHESKEIRLKQQEDGRVLFFDADSTIGDSGGANLALVLNRVGDETIEIFGSMRDMEEHDRLDPPINIT